MTPSESMNGDRLNRQLVLCGVWIVADLRKVDDVIRKGIELDLAEKRQLGCFEFCRQYKGVSMLLLGDSSSNECYNADE